MGARNKGASPSSKNRSELPTRLERIGQERGSQAQVQAEQRLGPLLSPAFGSLAQKAVETAGKREARARKLPAALALRLVVALGIATDCCSRQVLAYLWPLRRGLAWRLPTSKAISDARKRLGPRPAMVLLRSMAADQSERLDPETAPWAFHQGAKGARALELFCIDGTCLDVPNTKENERIFGRSPTRHENPSAFPQAQLVGWLGCGQRRLLDLEVRPRRRSEQQAAMRLIKRNARPGQLILWDRGFPNRYGLCGAIRERGAHFLIRLKSDIWKKAEEVYPDGSYLVRMRPSKKPKSEAIPMRVIEYKVGDSALIRIGTSLLDWSIHWAEDLAAAYRERWEIETAFDEIKTHQLGRPNGHWVAIRAQSPAGVIQEIYAIAVGHNVMRGLIEAVAELHDVDPDRISFKNTLSIVQRHLSSLSNASTSDQLVPLFLTCSMKSAWKSCLTKADEGEGATRGRSRAGRGDGPPGSPARPGTSLMKPCASSHEPPPLMP